MLHKWGCKYLVLKLIRLSNQVFLINETYDDNKELAITYPDSKKSSIDHIIVLCEIKESKGRSACYFDHILDMHTSLKWSILHHFTWEGYMNLILSSNFRERKKKIHNFRSLLVFIYSFFLFQFFWKKSLLIYLLPGVHIFF